MAPPKLTDAQKAANKAARERSNDAARAAGQPTEVERLNQQAIHDPGSMDRAPEVTRARDVVTVACKVGVREIRLDLFHPVDVMENTQTGPRKIIEHRRTGESVYLRGTAYPRGTPPAGFPRPPIIIEGAAMNMNVSREFWEKWLSQNQRNPLVVNGLVFAHKDRASVAAQARETAEIKSGLEPLDPRGGDKRIPKSTNASISNIETESERASRERAPVEDDYSFENGDV